MQPETHDRSIELAVTDDEAAVKALNAALAAAQSEFPAIPREKKVTVETKRGGRYTFSYAPLDAILNACRPALTKHGLALSQLLEDEGRGPSIRTELRHADGGTIGASFPLPHVPESPQELGSMLTYLRRYAIVALLGIATEEDDDGRQAAEPPAMPAHSSDGDTPPRPSSPVAPVEATREQNAEIRSLLDQLAQLDPSVDWRQHAESVAGPSRLLTRGGARLLLDQLHAEVEQRQESA